MNYSPPNKQDRGLSIKWTVQVTQEMDDAVKRWATDRGLSPSEAIRTLVRMSMDDTEQTEEFYVRAT